MTATLEIRFENLDGDGLAAVMAVVEAAAPGAWALEERRAGFWTARAPAGATGRPICTVTVYLEDDAEGALRLAAIEGGLAARAGAEGLRPVVVRGAAQPDWTEAWKTAHRPIDIGRRLRVVPRWDRTPAPGGRIRVRLDPGRAFGLGSHATTRLALVLLESVLRPGDRVADVGCGSGIVAVAALRLGAAHAAACDTDPVAVEATRRAAALNGVAGRLEVRHGGPDRLQGPFACVVVNVVAEVLRDILPAAAGLGGRRGRLVVSGLRAEQASEFTARLVRLGFEVRPPRFAGGFAAFVAARPAGP